MAADNVCRLCGNVTDKIGPKTKLCPGCARDKANERRRNSEVMRARRSAPEVKEKKRQYDADRNALPEIKERKAEQFRNWVSIPEVRLRRRQLGAKRERTPYWRQRRSEQRAKPEYRLRKRQRSAERERLPEVRVYRLYRNFVRRKCTPGKFTKADIDRILVAQRHKCAICGCSLKRAERHVDHIIPIARGGTHDPRNLQILCKPCNLKKGSSDPITHMRSLGRLI